MSNPKGKAQELVSKYLKASFNCTECIMPYCDIQCTKLSLHEAKECATIVCDEFISAMSTTHIGYCKEPFNVYYKQKKEYWLAVKAEIEKLY